MDLRLEGRRALVSGSSDGIGRAVARELAELGAAITLFARNRSKLDAVRATLPVGAGQQHHVLVADFVDIAAVGKVLADYFAQGHVAEILVNNTGGPPPGPAHIADLDAYRRAFEQHLFANQLLVQALLPGMKAAGYGRIINVVSTSVKQPIPNLGVSNTVRAAVANWAKTLAGELGPFGITVNNVLPGATRTGRLAAIFKDRAARSGRSLEEIEAEECALIPLRRLGEPEDLARAVAFLASPAASYITGTNLPVDGGRTLSL